MYSVDQIKTTFAACADQTALEHRLAALVAQYNHDQKIVQQFKSIAGQIKPSLPERAVKPTPTTSGPKDRTLRATRPADLDPKIWAQWLTIPAKTAQGNLSHWRTLLVRHDATGQTKSVHGEYRKGADGVEYFYAAEKVESISSPRIKVTPAQEIATYRAAQDKTIIELSSGAYDLLSRAERTIYAQAHMARLAAKKAAKKAQVAQVKAEDKASIAPAPVAEPVKIVVPVVRGTLSFK